MIVRAAGNPLSLVPSVRTALHGLDSQIPLSDVRTMGDELKQSTQRRRFFMILVSLFAATAMILVIAGTYGVMSYYVSRRTHEIGVRVALGADSYKVLRLFLFHGLRLVGVGVVIGIAVAIASAMVTSSWLYGVSPFSPMVLAGGALFMISIALAAISVPVFRATRVDPIEALRIE